MDVSYTALESALALAELMNEQVGIAIADHSDRCITSSGTPGAPAFYERVARHRIVSGPQAVATGYTIAVQGSSKEVEEVCAARARQLLAPATANHPPLGGDELRQVMGSFVTGVVVAITKEPATGRPAGLTATGLISLSLDPPLIGLSVGVSASSHPAFVGSTQFTVSVLHVEQSELALKLARSGPDKFTGVDLVETADGGWVLDEAVATLTCQTRGALRTGDHALIIGEVRTANLLGAGPGLLFFGGGQFGFPTKREPLGVA